MHVRLVYEAHSACAKQTEIEADVGVRLGYRPFVVEAEIRFEVVLFREKQHFVATIARFVGSTPAGARRLQSGGGSCDDLRTAVASALALAIDPAVSAPASIPAVPSSGPTVSTSAPVEKAQLGKRPAVRLGATVAGAIGIAPNVSAAVSVEVGVGFRFVSVAIVGRVDLPQSGPALASGGRVRTLAFTAAPLVCGHYRWFFGCARLALGALQGDGLDLASPERHTTFYMQIALFSGVEIPIVGPFLLRPFVEIGTTPTRTTIFIEQSIAWITPPVFGALGVTALFSL